MGYFSLFHVYGEISTTKGVDRRDTSKGNSRNSCSVVIDTELSILTFVYFDTLRLQVMAAFPNTDH